MIGELLTRQVLSQSAQGASAEEISENLKIPLESVKVALVANNSGTPEDQDISDAEIQNIRRNIYNLALTADNESVRFKASIALLERNRPTRKDPVQQNTIQIINQNITTATEAYKKLKESLNVSSERV